MVITDRREHPHVMFRIDIYHENHSFRNIMQLKRLKNVSLKPQLHGIFLLERRTQHFPVQTTVNNVHNVIKKKL